MSEELRGLDLFKKLRPSQIVVTGNVRKYFDEAKLQELAESIRENGIIEPLIVRAPNLEVAPDFKNDYFNLIAGERRLRAAKLAGLDRVPARVMFIDKKQAAKLQLIENVQREDLNPIEEAHAFRTLLDEHAYTQEALGAELGVSQSHIANRLRLLRLPEEVKENISRKIISAGHAHALLKLEKAPAFMKKAAEAIAEKQVPVTKTAEAIAKVVAEHGKPLFNDYGTKPEFDTGECEKCEFRVMGNQWSHSSESPYCIKPSCWEKKQQEVRRDRELALADRVQKAAKKGQGVVDLDKFNYDQYKEFVDYNTKDMDLSECEGCEHRKVAKKSYRDELAEACFQPSCFKKKQAAVTREKNKETREAIKQENNQIAVLAGLKAASLVKKWQRNNTNEFLTEVILDKPALVYLAAMILANVTTWNDRKITRYQYLKEKFGWEHVALKGGDYGLTKSDWDTFRELLETLTDEQLLEVIFEWPAVAHSLDGAPGWVLSGGEQMRPFPTVSEKAQTDIDELLGAEAEPAPN